MLLTALAHFAHQAGACSLAAAVGSCPIHPGHFLPPSSLSLRLCLCSAVQKPPKGGEKEHPLKDTFRAPTLLQAEPSLEGFGCSPACVHAVSGVPCSARLCRQCPAFHAVSGIPCSVRLCAEPLHRPVATARNRHRSSGCSPALHGSLVGMQKEL